jgi:hypothetical protein
MSVDEQKAAIGGMVMERNEARKHLTLLAQQIRDTGNVMSHLGVILMQQETKHSAALSEINRLPQIAGSLDQLRKAILDHQALEQRIADLTESLKAVGAE